MQLGSGESRSRLEPTKTFEIVDLHTIYRAFRVIDRNVAAHVNTIYKRCIDREVIVWRSVLDDVLVPCMADGNVIDKWGWYSCKLCREVTFHRWLVVEPSVDENTCINVITYLYQVVPSAIQKGRQGTFKEHVEVNRLLKSTRSANPRRFQVHFQDG
ncbi:hypothetical protein AC1031_002235 [Aphanomyces cochlioides]|nr:hypothetical protein AC1031_002235 [Aphanomyces cochlioides]